MHDLSQRVTQAERQIEREIGEARSLALQVKENEARISDAEDRAEALEEAIGILNSFADQKQEQIKSQVEGLVTHGLQTIFDDQDLSFRIVQEQKARRVETRFVVCSGELETSIMDARGGGVAAVAGFLLRLIVTLLQPHVRHFLLLDESFSHVSEQYESALVEFVRQLVDKTSVQIVLTTHKAVEEWTGAADKAYRFSLKEGRTVVTDVSADRV